MNAKILVVDDTPANIDLLVEILKDDYQVKAAVDGERALQSVEADPPDLILLDVMMPGMDGYEVCQRLKADEQTRDIPVIFVTAKSDTEDETRGLDLGAVDYVTKPVSAPIVRARIRNHLDLHDARESLKLLLNETLLGAARVQADLLAMANPEAAGRTARLRRLINHMVEEVGITSPWRINMAATLSQIACINLPAEALSTLYHGNPLITEEKSEEISERFFNHPELASSMIEDIPRLGPVAAIIQAQMEENLSMIAPDVDFDQVTEVLLGSWMLKTAIRYDELALNGASHEGIIESLQEPEERFPQVLVDALSTLPQPESGHRTLAVEDLEEGMLLLDDIYTQDGVQIMPAGFRVNPAVLDHLRAFTEEGFRGPVRVNLEG